MWSVLPSRARDLVRYPETASAMVGTVNLRAATAIALVGLAITPLNACGSGATGVRGPGDSPQVEMVRGSRDRAAVSGSSSDRIGAMREALVAVAEKGAVFLEVRDATNTALLELPTTRAL